jgi:dTDP-6-deoxy-L-talose 4-dehydrogenase [NAD(P)+]
MRPGRAVVLGGSGFLGRHICDAFVAAGDEVIAVSRRLDRVPRARVVRLDLADTNPGTLRDLLAAAAPTVVVNAAGGVWGVSEEQLVASNVTVVRHVVTAVAGLPRPTRLIQLGSVHEYGPVPVGEPITEATEPNPVDPYGRTKLIGSRHVLDAAGYIDAAVLRVGNVTGPGAPTGSLLGRVASQLRAAAGTGEPAVLTLAPLRSKRDFVDVRDVARAVVAAATAPVRGAVVNVGRGEAVSVRWLVDTLIEASGLPARVVETADPAKGARGAGIEWQQIDPTTARRLLGWRPAWALTDSLRALWESAATQPESQPVLASRSTTS